ncbi:ArnT family glycosyltransferase [Halapricum hydrolyticum]|uniref:Glycosyltransferase family 39 protein n=1 Tax=Halapricum hydrolyticum TaxID=2979991 RepID=A0AAE3LDT3_9EURY|nr:glycosyltransferase family 39 protein [Halapricum hydrolyticum]MCU4716918.1 glycosyltransferase family 39 protein [Halapricum hydrolyticum]MCU4725477.1 glycosyltransferase family 39 protein [Halapricum hydrolyticum]
MAGPDALMRRLPAPLRKRARDPETRWRVAVGLLALLAGAVVLLIATRVFPSHSLNHDEGVYLQQARMLLDGQLFLRPPVPEAFRPWFFVESDAGMYSKYSPVVPAMYAPALAFGAPRLVLAAVGAGIVALVAALGAELFDRPTGLLAGVVVLASPLFLLNAATFLPYAPTTLLNLTFALSYLRADRTESPRLAAVAGGAIGLAFFARPYTAVLFAAPFVGHALWTLRTRDREVWVRQGIVAAVGLVGVVAALGYNALVTGSILEFPYHAFAPRDGVGFGTRELLGRELEYTPELAARSNARALETLARDWAPAGLLGVALAAVGLVVALRNRTPRRLAVAGLVVSVPIGEAYFWGTLNILGDVTETGDGLIAYLGPYYHFDLLVPLALFAALSLRAAGSRAWVTLDCRFESRQALAASLAIAAVVAAVGGAAAVATAAEPVNRNRAVTERYEAAYEPFEEQSFEHALVFLPQPYGPWLNHPLQPLRNDPDYDGPVVFALEERPFAVVDAFPERQPYRYSFRNPWPPTAGEPVEPRLRPVEVVEGDAVELSIAAGLPTYAQSVSIRMDSGDGRERRAIAAAGSTLRLSLELSDGVATLDGPEIEDPVRVPVDGRETLELDLFVDYGTGTGFSYALSTPVAATDGTVRAISPRLQLCELAQRCDGAAAYVPGATRQGQTLNATLEVIEP